MDRYGRRPPRANHSRSSIQPETRRNTRYTTSITETNIIGRRTMATAGSIIPISKLRARRELP
jgi:hypothetical protein